MIQIGTAYSLGNPDSSGTAPDDRQELVKTLSYTGGVFAASAFVVDMGHIAAGDVLSFTGVNFNAANWEIVKAAWLARTLVTVIDEVGNSFSNCRVRVVKYKNIPKFAGFVAADIDIWRV